MAQLTRNDFYYDEEVFVDREFQFLLTQSLQQRKVIVEILELTFLQQYGRQFICGFWYEAVRFIVEFRHVKLRRFLIPRADRSDRVIKISSRSNPVAEDDTFSF